MNIDLIQRIADHAKPHGLTILEHFLPGGKKAGKEYQVRNPHRTDEHLGNLSIEVASGKGGDFATGETFGDYVAVVAFATRAATMSDAAETLACFLNISTSAPAAAPPKGTTATWTPVMPVPENAPPPPKAHPRRGRPSATHAYHAADGRVIGYVCRWEAKGEQRKEFSPLTWCVNQRGQGEWRWQGWTPKRPLYGLDLVDARPVALVIVVEGEKAADAARSLLPEFVAVTWPNGAASVDKADFLPLAGRDVILWPDHDDAGTKAMQDAAQAIKKAGAKSVRFVDRAVFAKRAISKQGQMVKRPGELPAGWDAADAQAEGWTTETLGRVIVETLVDRLERDAHAADGEAEATDASEESAVPKQEAATAGPYVVDEALGLFYVEQDKDGKVRQTRVCGVLKIEALARDSEGAGWAPVLEFRDRDGRTCQEVIPYRLFLGQGIDGLKLLADLGLEIEPTTRALDLLRRYVVGAKPPRRARRVSTTGWHGSNFVFPDGAIGEADEVLLFDGSRRAEGVYAPAGKLAQWQANIASRAVGNPMLMLLLSLSFAGPLLKPLGLAGFALHLVGDSSTGKTAGLAAAGSTWGPTEAQVKSWRSTSNALEHTCALHNHTLLCLDEFREVDPKDATPITYMIANGRGKGRAHHAGGLRESPAWAIVMLSSGELGLGDHIAAAGQKQYAGQEVRFIELDADAGARLGMWNDVGASVEGGKGFSDALKRAAMRYHGTAGHAFIGHCCKHYDELPGLWRAHEARFAQRYKPQEAAGQVIRVMTAFSLIGFAGELAARWGVTTWNEGDALQAAGAMFDKWRRARPTQGNSEEGQILAHVRNLMERSWHSKFHEWDRVDKEADLSRTPSIIEPLGFRKVRNATANDYFFYVTRGRFEAEFAQKAGFKTRRVAAVLKTHGILRCDDESTTYKETLPNGDPRSYCLIGSVLWELAL